MVGPDEQNQEEDDQVSGDKITADDIEGSAVAFGRGAQATINYNTYIQSGETPPVWVGVPPMPAPFVGRDGLVQDLAQQLTSSSRLALSADGLPGVGKTTLAVALAHHRDVLAHFKDGVLWAGLGREATEADAAAVLARWANALGIDVTDKSDTAARKQIVEDAIGQRALLMVIDDVWDHAVAKHLRFGNPRCRQLLTTRDQAIARQFAGAGQAISVPTLDDDPAFQLLQELAPEACAADLGAAKALAQNVGGLPLALELLGGYLAIPEHSLFPELSQEALAAMMDPRRRLGLAEERLGAPGQEVTLQEAIALSIDGLRGLANGEELARAFYALGAFAPKPEQFSLEAAAAVAGVDLQTLALLVGRNLVEKLSLAGTGTQLALHQVLAEVARTKLDPAAVARHWDYYLRLVNRDREDWQGIEQVYGQIKWAWQAAPEREASLEMVWALRVFQERRGLWQDKLSWAQRGLSWTRQYKWRELEGTLLNDIGWVYYKVGQREKALEHYNRALPIREEVGDRAGQAQTLNNMGNVYYRLGQREKALEQYSRALLIREEVGDRAGQATTLNNIGLVYYTLDQREKALEQYNRALQIREEVGDRAGQATTRHNIGLVYSKLDQGEKALEQYHQALTIRKEVGDRAGQAQTLNSIGNVHYNRGKREKALEYYYLSLPISEELGYRAGMVVTLYNLAMIYRDQGQLHESIAYLKQVVELDRTVQHPDLEDDMAMLAQVEAELAAQEE